MRERLIEAIRESHCVDTWNYYTDDFKEPNPIDQLADYLLANGVIVPPCKVGDIVWLISDNGQYVFDTDVEIVFCDRDGVYIETIRNDIFTEEDFGKKVFLTKEEAEAVLKGGREE